LASMSRCFAMRLSPTLTATATTAIAANTAIANFSPIGTYRRLRDRSLLRTTDAVSSGNDPLLVVILKPDEPIQSIDGLLIRLCIRIECVLERADIVRSNPGHAVRCAHTITEAGYARYVT